MKNTTTTKAGWWTLDIKATIEGEEVEFKDLKDYQQNTILKLAGLRVTGGDIYDYTEYMDDMEEVGDWVFGVDCTLEGEEVEFETLSEESQEHIRGLVSAGCNNGQIIEEEEEVDITFTPPQEEEDWEDISIWAVNEDGQSIWDVMQEEEEEEEEEGEQKMEKTHEILEVKGYNGWTNWNTWSVLVLDLIDQEEATRALKEEHGGWFEVWDVQKYIDEQLSDLLYEVKENPENYNNHIRELIEDGIWKINTREIAESLHEDIVYNSDIISEEFEKWEELEDYLEKEEEAEEARRKASRQYREEIQARVKEEEEKDLREWAEAVEKLTK